jgi:hypothetical protein
MAYGWMLGRGGIRMKIFLISPVRNINEEEQKKIADYVKKLESKGHKVHWPIRDTDQNDPIGIDICNQNFKSISNADEIHIWFNPTSTGTLFDLGGAFMIWHMYKDIKFVFANKNDFVDDPTGGKSFFKVLKYLDEYKED